MSAARRAIPSRLALVSAAALVVAIDTSRARAQDDDGAKPKVVAPPPKAPEPFVVDRGDSAVEFTLAFQLGDDEKSKLRVHFDDARPSTSGAEQCTLGLDFEPLEGSRFTWSRVMAFRDLESALLASTPEPKELRFELKVRFPPQQGVEVTLADGTPLLVARTPKAPKLRVSIDGSGDVLSLSATAPKATSDRRLVELLAAADAKETEQDFGGVSIVGPLPVHAWQLATLTESGLPIVPPAQPVDEIAAPEGAIERVTLDPSAGGLMLVPTLVVKPKRGTDSTLPSRACVVVGGDVHGKSEPAVLAQIAKRAQQGCLVVAVDLFGCGERRDLQPFDSLESPEPRLVGKLAEEYAADELRQVVAWTRRRPDVDSEQVELDLDAPSMEAMRRAKAIASEAIPEEVASEKPSVELVNASTFGLDLVRSRFDSWLLQQAFEASDGAAIDRGKPLVERIARGATEEGVAPTNVWTLGTERAKSTLLCASDFGPAAALDFALDQKLGAGDDVRLVASYDGTLDDFWRAIDSMEEKELLWSRVESVAAQIRALPSPPGAPHRVRLFGEGSCGVVMLLVATLHPDLVESVTALHSIPSFETLLRRPGDVRRAPDSLEVLSQGMPTELFVCDALRRFELEECVLELKSKGIAVDWREPVGALRRPLPRHDRLAMWPRVRRLESKR